MTTKEEKIKALLSGNLMAMAMCSSRPLPRVKKYYTVHRSSVYYNDQGIQVKHEDIPKNQGGIILAMIVTYPENTDLPAIFKEKTLSNQPVTSNPSQPSRMPI